jgi:hypothetical protein
MFAGLWRIVAAAASVVGCWGGRGLTVCVAGGWRDGQAKKGLDKGKGEGELKDGFVFLCFLIFLLFFGLSFSMQVYWFLIKIKLIVGWASLARFLFQ